MIMTESKEFFSSAEVAKVLKISRIAVFKRIKSGEIKASKIGRNYVVPKEEVLKALGLFIGEETKSEIDRAVRKALKQYEEVFRRLGKE